MDACSVELTVEFLSVAFHNILYYSGVYPESAFETRRAYSLALYRCFHPHVDSYIRLCLGSVASLLKSGCLDRIDFAITNIEYDPLIKFVFEFEKPVSHNQVDDPYLVQLEQNFRAFCLGLASVKARLRSIPEDASFSILLYADESSAVSLANDPELNSFPLVEVDRQTEKTEHIIPLRRFTCRGNNIETFIEQ